MVEPEKPFACTMPDCGKTFTNEDHLNVHTKKHDMVLQLGMEQKAAFVADQTPTPTRFIRNCEEVGLFQDLQNVNPFDEGFKRAMETKHGILSLENALGCNSDDLHTPQMVFPSIDPGDSTLFSSTNNQRNITISRSSSDESGAIKEFETTTISKLTNEVTISRIVEKHDEKPKDDSRKNDFRKDSVSYTNNVIKISSNVAIRKDSTAESKNPTTLISEDTLIRNAVKDMLLPEKLHDTPVNNLENDVNKNVKDSNKLKQDGELEVIVKLPNGKQVTLKSVEDTEPTSPIKTKELLKKAIFNKVEKNPVKQGAPMLQNFLLPTGTLIPVTLVNTNTRIVPRIPILPLNTGKVSISKKTVKRKAKDTNEPKDLKGIDDSVNNSDVTEKDKNNGDDQTKRNDLESRSAASRRYRARLKSKWTTQAQEIKKLREVNMKLMSLKNNLELIIAEHIKKCPNADDIKSLCDIVLPETSAHWRSAS